VRRFASAAFLLLAALGLSTSCAHYRLGAGAAPTFHSVYIAPVENKTALPQARALVSTQLRETFARDGRVTLANSSEAADAILSVTLSDFHRDTAAAREGDTGLARKFNLVLGATCTLRDRSGKIVFENRTISATREAFTDSGQLEAEYQTLPLLAESLSGKIAHAALDVW
jgi:hypothetical protein